MKKITAKEYEKMVAKKNIEWAKRQGVDLEDVTPADALKLAIREACERYLVLNESEVTDQAVKEIETDIR